MFSKKEKTYKFNRFGYAQAKLDAKLEKQEKINNAVSTIVFLGFLGLGLLSREYLILYLSSKGISIITDFLVK